MTPVYSQRLSSETFWKMVEMMIVLKTFASNGSGWLREKVMKVIVNFAATDLLPARLTLHYLQNYKIAAVYLIFVTMRT